MELKHRTWSIEHGAENIAWRHRACSIEHGAWRHRACSIESMEHGAWSMETYIEHGMLNEPKICACSVLYGPCSSICIDYRAYSMESRAQSITE